MFTLEYFENLQPKKKHFEHVSDNIKYHRKRMKRKYKLLEDHVTKFRLETPRLDEDFFMLEHRYKNLSILTEQINKTNEDIQLFQNYLISKNFESNMKSNLEIIFNHPSILDNQQRFQGYTKQIEFETVQPHLWYTNMFTGSGKSSQLFWEDAYYLNRPKIRSIHVRKAHEKTFEFYHDHSKYKYLSYRKSPYYNRRYNYSNHKPNFFFVKNECEESKFFKKV
jgi:hypothetical protein